VAPAPESNLDEVAQSILNSAARLSGQIRRSTDGLTSFELVQDVAVTHYGAGFNGQTLGCGGATYSSDNGGIVAVGPERDVDWPCGTVLRVCGPGGCMIGERQDGCPGCDAYVIDLSEEGLYLVCGPGTGVCRASVEAFAPPCHVSNGALVSEVGGVREGAGMRLFAMLAETALADRTANLLDITSPSPATAGICTVQAR